MHHKARWLLSALLLTAPLCCAHGDAPQQESSHNTFKPFTGKVVRNKVRLRLQPNLDGQILRELVKDDLLVVVGEEDEFYSVLAPKGTRSYIYRTYVIDNEIEGTRVNVRLEPDTESPVIAQLNTGDKVDGVVSPLNSKWLEITPPPTTRFFVCKEYIENIGDPSMIGKMEKRREEVNSLLNSTQLVSHSELQKPFEEINLDTVFSNLNKITQLYADFPDQVARAKEMLTRIQDTYIQKKIAYLEHKAAVAGQVPMQGTLSLQMRNQQEQFSQLGQKLESAPVYADVPVEKAQAPAPIDWNQAFDTGAKSDKMIAWIPIEKDLYESWLMSHEQGNLHTYYQEQQDNALVIRGIVEPYQRAIRSKPGDYILISRGTNLPIAYLYSTQVSLQDYVGKETTMRVTPRPNNHFAFPAYFVIAVD